MLRRKTCHPLAGDCDQYANYVAPQLHLLITSLHPLFWIERATC